MKKEDAFMRPFAFLNFNTLPGSTTLNPSTHHCDLRCIFCALCAHSFCVLCASAFYALSVQHTCGSYRLTTAPSYAPSTWGYGGRQRRTSYIHKIKKTISP